VCVCLYVCISRTNYIYILLVSALLRFLIIETTIETDVSMVDEHNVSFELLVGNSLNQGWPQESGNVL
jgi:hypothetical protein